MTSADVDAYKAAGIPQQNEMFLPLKEKKAIDGKPAFEAVRSAIR